MLSLQCDCTFVTDQEECDHTILYYKEDITMCAQSVQLRNIVSLHVHISYCTIQLVIYLSYAAIYYICFTLDLFQNTTITVNTLQHCEGWGRPECDGIQLCIQYLMLLLYHTSLVPRLHPLQCILTRE